MLNLITSIAKDRRRHITPLPVLHPPQLIDPPAIISGGARPDAMYLPSQEWEWWALEGSTLTATVGNWDVTDGPVTLSYQWWDAANDVAMGPLGSLSYTVMESDLGARVLYLKVTATRDGLTTVAATWNNVLPTWSWAGPPQSPVMWVGVMPGGSHAPGQIVTKPAITWTDPYAGTGMAAMVVQGEWFKNGIATGSHAETYSATVEGDALEWRESATNESGTSTNAPMLFPVSAFVENYKNEVLDEFRSLVAGKVGGAAGMNVYSVINHATQEFVRNPNCWLPRATLAYLVSKVVSHGAETGGYGAIFTGEYGGIMITPRHVLFCNHAHPAAGTHNNVPGTGTWGVNRNLGPQKLRFVRMDGSVAEVTLLMQTYLPDVNACRGGTTIAQMEAMRASDPNLFTYNLQLHPTPDLVNPLGNPVWDYWDLCVGVVDVDVTTLGIPVIPTMRVADGMGIVPLMGPLFAISQDGLWANHEAYNWHNVIGDYPFPNRPMAWISGYEPNKVGVGQHPLWEYDQAFRPFAYEVWPGDSGTPSFLLHRGIPYLYYIISGSNPGYPPTNEWVNAAIAHVDSVAVAQGRMSEVTGLTLNPFDPPASYPPPFIETKGGMDSGFVDDFNGAYWTRHSFAGATLTYYPNIWDQAQGPTIVHGQWWNLESGCAAGPLGVSSYTVKAQDVGATLVWREVAHRGEHEVIKMSDGSGADLEYVRVVAKGSLGPNFIPQLNNPDWTTMEPTATSRFPGATASRPNLIWAYPAQGLLSLDITWTWIKNGADTGVSTATYSDVAEGDSLQYREEALGAAVDPGVMLSGALKFSNLYGTLQRDLTPAFLALVGDKLGGAANMNVYSSYNHLTGTYTRNTNLWSAPLVSQLTGVVAVHFRSDTYATAGGEISDSYGGVFITQRHLLFCNHAHPAADVSWPTTTRMRLRFVRADNTVVHATIISNTTLRGDWGTLPPDMRDSWIAANPGATGFDAYQPDLCVVMVDVTADSLGLPVVPIPVFNQDDFNELMKLGPLFECTQGSSRNPTHSPTFPDQPPLLLAADYPRYNDPMVIIGDYYYTAGRRLQNFSYRAWKGDSGTPYFMLYRNTVYLMGVCTMGAFAGELAFTHIAEINALIAAADDAAVRLGRLSAPTGLTVVPVPLPLD